MKTKRKGAGVKNWLKKTIPGSRLTGSVSDNVGTWKGDPYVAPPIRKIPLPLFTTPPPPESPPTSNPGSTSSTPPRSTTPTAIEKLRTRKNTVPDGVITSISSQVKPGWYGVQPAHGLGRSRKRRGTNKRKTHRRRR